MPASDEPLTRQMAELLSRAPAAVAYEVGYWLRGYAAPRTLVETNESGFAIDPFAEAGHCALAAHPGVRQKENLSWFEEHGVCRSLEIGWLDVAWQGHTLEVVRAE